MFSTWALAMAHYTECLIDGSVRIQRALEPQTPINGPAQKRRRSAFESPYSPLLFPASPPTPKHIAKHRNPLLSSCELPILKDTVKKHAVNRQKHQLTHAEARIQVALIPLPPPSFHCLLPDPSPFAMSMLTTSQMRRENTPLLSVLLLPHPLQCAALLLPFMIPIRNMQFLTSSSLTRSSKCSMLLFIPQLLCSVLELHQAPPWWSSGTALLLLSMHLTRNMTFPTLNLMTMPSGCLMKLIRSTQALFFH